MLRFVLFQIHSFFLLRQKFHVKISVQLLLVSYL